MMILLFIALIIIAVFVLKMSKMGKARHAREVEESSSLPEGLQIARQHAEEIGDTEALQAIDNGTYKDLLEKRAANRQASMSAGVKYRTFDIAGINFRRGIANYVGESTGYLKPQPTNQHDPNAIAIYAADGHHLGYISANETNYVRDLRLRFPIPVYVNIEECYDDYESRRFYVGTVCIKYKKK